MQKENKSKLVILNLIQDLQRMLARTYEGNNKRGRCQLKFAMTSLCNKGAFTLIELLVVVLIIGILAAIALPQYQKAVAKSRLAEAIATARILKQAQEIYYMSNGHYADTLAELDMDVRTPQNTSIIVHSATDRVIVTGTNAGDPYQMDIIYALDHGWNEKDKAKEYRGALYCSAPTAKPRAIELCKSYTGKVVDLDSLNERYRIN